MWRQLLLNGVVAGAVYGLLALGFSLTYRIDAFFQFSYGSLISFAPAVAWLICRGGRHAAIGAIGAVLATALLAVLIQGSVYSPLRRHHASSLVLFLASLGVGTSIQNLLSIVCGDDLRYISPVTPPRAMTIAGVRLTSVQILTVACAVFAGQVLYWLLTHTRSGRAIRALADDAELARVVGVDIAASRLGLHALGGLIAGLGGLLIAYDVGFSPVLGFNLLLTAAVAAIVGGLSRPAGGITGGLVLGMARNLGIWGLASEWQDTIVFSLLLCALLFKRAQR
jgi:branched-chain amino acid transport system permease protein